MIYLDTSVVVALLTPEESSSRALDWFAQSLEPLISSAFTASVLRHARLLGSNSSPCCRAEWNFVHSIAVAFARRPSCSRIRPSACGLVTPCSWRWRCTAAAALGMRPALQ